MPGCWRGKGKPNPRYLIAARFGFTCELYRCVSRGPELCQWFLAPGSSRSRLSRVPYIYTGQISSCQLRFHVPHLLVPIYSPQSSSIIIAHYYLDIIRKYLFISLSTYSLDDGISFQNSIYYSILLCHHCVLISIYYSAIIISPVKIEWGLEAASLWLSVRPFNIPHSLHCLSTKIKIAINYRQNRAESFAAEPPY